MADFNKAIELDPNNARAYAYRAGIYAGNSEDDLAIADLNKAIELGPMLAEAYFRRGAFYGLKDEHALAKVDLAKAIELDWRFAAVVNGLFGRDYMEDSAGDPPATGPP
jgi:tetratricopeptide (TPR) repeat protein